MRNLVSALALAASFLAALPAAAQSLEPRVERLEGEMRAVQRKVFPGGQQYVQPDITPGRTQAEPLGAPATSPVADLTARVDALEGQLRELTGQVEQAGNRARQTSDAFATYRRETDARIAALESARAPAASAPAAGTPEAAAAPAATQPATSPAAVAGVTRRAPTGDAGEDAYMAGYDLWAAKAYPEAEKQLQAAYTKYPKHKRASYARNLYGRALMDDGQLNSAARAFLENYRTLPEGERAPDSLYFLAQTLTRLKKPKADICKVYAELGDVYGAKLRSDLAAQVATGRRQAGCA